jgi:hypothetical protein
MQQAGLELMTDWPRTERRLGSAVDEFSGSLKISAAGVPRAKLTKRTRIGEVASPRPISPHTSLNAAMP